MNDQEVPAATDATIASQVSAFYERHPYPPPVDDLPAYRRAWDHGRRRAEPISSGRPSPTAKTEAYW